MRRTNRFGKLFTLVTSEEERDPEDFEEFGRVLYDQKLYSVLARKLHYGVTTILAMDAIDASPGVDSLPPYPARCGSAPGAVHVRYGRPSDASRNAPDTADDEPVEMVRAIVEEPEKHDLRVFAHITSLGELQTALEGGAAGVVHTVWDRPFPDAELANPYLRETVSEKEMAMLRDPEFIARFSSRWMTFATHGRWKQSSLKDAWWIAMHCKSESQPPNTAHTAVGSKQGLSNMITVFGEGRGFRVVWLLEEMGVPYDLRPVDLLAGVENDAEYLAINPSGFIPAIRDGDVTMVESIAIMEYAMARYGPTPLSPDSSDAAFPAYQQFLHFGEASLAAPFYIVAVSRNVAPEAERENWGARMALDIFKNRLALVTRQLARYPYLAGDEFTAADISVTYALEFAQRHGVYLGESEQAYLARTTVRDAYHRAMEACKETKAWAAKAAASSESSLRGK